MHLWTEYEGKTVNGDYTLGRLLRSEGRNGFFSTTDKNGRPAVIRLTEAHYDEEQQLARWRQVAALKQPHLIPIENVGRTDLEGITLTFALMEADDANLEEVLKDRTLTATETLQVARAVTEALQSLHANGLVHENIEPLNVRAVGEVVKLRSDCVRECVADGEFRSAESCVELRKRDVQALGRLLLRCLTLETELHANSTLPEPFYRIVPPAIAGTLTLEQIISLLGPSEEAKAAAEAKAASEREAREAATAQAAAQSAAKAAETSNTASQSLQQPQPTAEAASTAMPPRFRPRNELRNRTEEGEQGEKGQPGYRLVLLAAGGIIVLILAVFGLWRLLASKDAPKSAETAPVVAAPANSTAASANPIPAAAPTAAPAAASAPVKGWHVIAYTYNHQDQAEAKARSVARRHANLNPQLFMPTSHGPYLVALGGVMSEPEAKATLQRARRSGLPRDTFMRNY